MHYGNNTIVGILDVPQKVSRGSQYSRRDAVKQYDYMQQDIYTKIKSSPTPSKGQFPTILKYVFGITGVAAILFFGKSIGKGLKYYFKNYFK